MKRLMIFLMAILLLLVWEGSAVIKEGVRIIKKIPYHGHGQAFPSICANYKKDILMLFRTEEEGVMFYFIPGDGSDHIGPEVVPGQNYLESLYEHIESTDCDADSNGLFHCAWHIFGVKRGYYATFDPDTHEWSEPGVFSPVCAEPVKLKINPVNDDVAISYCHYVGQKDIYVAVKRYYQSYFAIYQNISNYRRSGTNQDMNFDEEGFLYVVHKQKYPRIGDHHPSKLGLLNPLVSYRMDWYDDITIDYYGWHFWASVAVINKRGYLTAAYVQRQEYKYLEIKREQNPEEEQLQMITFDADEYGKNAICDIPPLPHPWFKSLLLPYGDHYLFVHKALDHSIDMYKMDLDFNKINETPIEVSKAHTCTHFFDAYSCYNIGLLTIWQSNLVGDAIYYSIYDYPRPEKVIRSAIPTEIERIVEIEGTFFYYVKKWVNYVTWEENPLNELYRDMYTIMKYKLYRRLPDEEWGEDKLLQVFERGSELFESKVYKDDNLPITQTEENHFIYAITCVDENGNESLLGEYQGY